MSQSSKETKSKALPGSRTQRHAPLVMVLLTLALILITPAQSHAASSIDNRHHPNKHADCGADGKEQKDACFNIREDLIADGLSVGRVEYCPVASNQTSLGFLATIDCANNQPGAAPLQMPGTAISIRGESAVAPGGGQLQSGSAHGELGLVQASSEQGDVQGVKGVARPVELHNSGSQDTSIASGGRFRLEAPDGASSIDLDGVGSYYLGGLYADLTGNIDGDLGDGVAAAIIGINASSPQGLAAYLQGHVRIHGDPTNQQGSGRILLTGGADGVYFDNAPNKAFILKRTPGDLVIGTEDGAGRLFFDMAKDGGTVKTRMSIVPNDPNPNDPNAPARTEIRMLQKNSMGPDVGVQAHSPDPDLVPLGVRGAPNQAADLFRVEGSNFGGQRHLTVRADGILNLSPRSSLPACTGLRAGDIAAYDSGGTTQPCFCNGSSWVDLSGGGGCP